MMGVAYDDVCAFFPAEWIDVREEVARFIVLLVEFGERDPSALKAKILGSVGGELSLALH